MEGFSNRTAQKKNLVIIAGFKGDKKNPKFQIWNRDYDPNQHQLQDYQEVRGGYCYDTYGEFIGRVDSMSLVDVEIPYDGTKKKYTRLYVNMAIGEVDKEVITTFDMGTYTGRYAHTFLLRLINPEVNLADPIKMFPYHVAKDGEKPSIGVAVYQKGPKGEFDKKIEFLKKEVKQAMGVPEPVVIQTDIGLQWVWGIHIKWLLEYVVNRLVDARFKDSGQSKPSIPVEPPPLPLHDDDILEPSEPIVVDPIQPHPGMDLYPPKYPANPGPFNNPGFVDPNDDLPF